MVLFPLLAEAGLHVSSWLCSQVLLGSSLDCSNFGLEADERSVRPITEELEVLEELVAGLQHIELIGEVGGEGGGGLSQPRCFNSQHLWTRRQA